MTRDAKRTLILSVAAVTAIGISSAISFAPKLVWNDSASAPIGLYRIGNTAPETGDFVLVAPSSAAAELIKARHYLPPGMPLIKRVAALPGDEICREKLTIFVNGIDVANAQKKDSVGREMPSWSGCYSLQNDQVFLLNEHEQSLDGRYFGATKLSDVIGVAIPVFVGRRDG